MDRTVVDHVLQFDDLIRCFGVLLSSSCEKEFLCYVSNQEVARLKWVETTNECKRLKIALDAANKSISVLEDKLSSARKLMDDEKQSRKKAETERDTFAYQLEEARRVLFSDPRYKVPDETKEKLSFLSKTGCNYGFRGNNLNTVEESDCTTSLLSDFSFSRSGDDLDESSVFPKRRARRSYFADEDAGTIKRKKSMNPVVTFTPTAPRAESVESLPNDVNENEPQLNFRTPIIERINARTHSFVAHNTIMRQTCQYCSKKSGFNRTMYKCKGCNAVAHSECLDKVPLPCLPMGTPKKGAMNTISAYAPLVPPMIPAIVIHCVNEIEQRGLKEVGIYRISGCEGAVRELKEKFLRGRGAPNLAEECIHDICSFLKEFLRDLHDPLIPRSEWNTFAGAIYDSDKKNKLYRAISMLPQANRDTLAYLILHLQHVASSPECKMTLSSLSTIFGPTVVGYSNNEQTNAFVEAQTANNIMEELLSLPSDYWCSFISVSSAPQKIQNAIRSTPLKTTQNAYTPGRKRFFYTSPQNN